MLSSTIKGLFFWGMNYDVALKEWEIDSNISDISIFDVSDNGMTIQVGAKSTFVKINTGQFH